MMSYGSLAAWLADGYVLDDECKLQRGYCSRRPRKPEETPVYLAGGSRYGEPYILEPNRVSTRFCYRRYLVKHTEEKEN